MTNTPKNLYRGALPSPVMDMPVAIDLPIGTTWKGTAYGNGTWVIATSTLNQV